jgi:hypothetical protein
MSVVLVIVRVFFFCKRSSRNAKMGGQHEIENKDQKPVEHLHRPPLHSLLTVI